MKSSTVYKHPAQLINFQFPTSLPSFPTSSLLEQGVDVQSVQFSNTGSFTLAIDIAGLGNNKPYDTKHSGLASTSLTVYQNFH